eukprot:CAMPEP_0184685948 /NCGR_PEP_ID=MMETSP0312-20130426/20808_1 /TAXON_ID=31354 /ORGANISM="Compsopogon coeruleus, Strain SAG 36.94" /LENGTH=42 /DNA_ID= /DNA_START= /DNA_END= /DNA_ORIENTATION=
MAKATKDMAAGARKWGMVAEPLNMDIVVAMDLHATFLVGVAR